MNKKVRMGKNPLDWVKDTRDEKLPVKQKNISTNKHTNIETVEKLKRETFYIYPAQKKKLKYLSIEINRDLSDLVRSALDNLFEKYKK